MSHEKMETPEIDSEAIDQADEDESPTLSSEPVSEATTSVGSEDDDGSEISMSAGVISGDYAKFVAVEKNFYQDSSEFNWSRPRLLSVHDFEKYDIETIRADAESPFIDQAFARHAVQLLCRYRVLILLGDREVGKGKLAQSISGRLPADEKVQGLHWHRRRLSKEMQLDLWRLVAEADCAQRVLLLEDVLAGGNSDAVAFLSGLDLLQVEQLREEMERNETFLILTLQSHLQECVSNWARSQVVMEVPLPSKQHLEGFLRQHCSQCLELPDVPSETLLPALEAWLDEPTNLSLVTEAVQTLPRLARFLDEWLVRLLEQQVSLKEALDNFDDRSRFLLERCALDVDELSALLALVFCCVDEEEDDVGWYGFDRLRAVVRDYLQRLAGVRRQVEGPAPSQARMPPFFQDKEHVLRSIRATTTRTVEGLRIRFDDRGDASRIWQVLVGPGAQFLTAVIPLLDRLTKGDEPLLRDIALRVLGRAGELDLYGILIPRFRLSALGAETHHQLWGLFKGAMTSGDADFRFHCLAAYRRFFDLDDLDRARVAITGLKALGRCDLPAAMREIRRLTERVLVRPFEKWNRVDSQAQQLNRVLKKNKVSLPRKKVRDLVYAALHELLPKEADFHVLATLQYTLVGLSFEAGTIAVLRELILWMPPGRPRLAPIVAFYFLRPEGFLDVLERHPIRMERKDGVFEYWNPILFWGDRETDGLDVLYAFLFEVHFVLTRPSYSEGPCLPESVAALLRRRFVEMLKGWVQQACKVQRYRSLLARLLDRFLDAAEAPDLKDDVFGLLQYDPELQERGSQVAEFTAEVLSKDVN